MAATRSSGVGDVYQPLVFSTGGATVSFIAGATGFGAYLGHTAAETNGGTANFRIHDGVSTGASNCVTSLVTLAANQSISDWFGPQGVAVATGVYIEVVSGHLEIVVYGS